VATYRIVTLGCKVNQYESAGIGEALRNEGWSAAPDGGAADAVIINTCTVTAKASMQSRQQIRQAIRANPDARVVVTGCYAEIQPDEIRAIAGVDAVIGNRDKHQIPAAVMDAVRGTPAVHPERGRLLTSPGELPVTRFEGRTRPFLKIQDGCDAFCTYCIVPYARGRSRSLPPEEVLARLRAFNAFGYREVVLTGIHLGVYGLDLTPKSSLAALLKSADADDMPARIRLSSIEPTEVTSELLSLLAASDRFCRHLHVPLQSGDDGILKRMHRPYTRDDYARTINKIRHRLPDAAIGADVLIGFPGEDDDAYGHTRELIASLPVTYLHVFPYSPRVGTPAARFSNPVPPQTVKARCSEMRRIGAAKRLDFHHGHLGRALPVMVESRRDRDSGRLRGLTGNYIPVQFSGPDRLMDTIAQVSLTGVDDEGRVRGRIATAE
jgi:threonylcarbamoyladenosine tRNA methylthiotransferase MtaB